MNPLADYLRSLGLSDEAIFSILRSLNTADELLPRLVGQPGSDAYPARLLFAIVDNYRRELANLGR